MKSHKPISEYVDEYLSYRRALGYRLAAEGQQLQRFARYIDFGGSPRPLSAQSILAWVTHGEQSTKFSRARRLEVVRPFVRYLACLEPGTQIPPNRLFGSAHRRVQPYIYTHKEISALIREALRLTPVDGLRPRTYATFIGLMASAGLRTCETLNLERDDVDLREAVLTVRETKFHASRLVPLHATVISALKRYAHIRDCSFLGHG